MGSNLSHNSIFKEQPVFPPKIPFPFQGTKNLSAEFASSAAQIFESLRVKGISPTQVVNIIFDALSAAYSKEHSEGSNAVNPRKGFLD